jgi:hypothetical protein
MVTKKHIENFLEYINEYFGEKEVNKALKENEFDKETITKENLKNLNSEELLVLYGDLVYITTNELLGGNFEMMYELLETMELDEETINYLLDW